uniref:CID domain-containing protein n=1 Tax=Arion vulgaris TaxID=1028688 RepID=A0A0B7AY03_9EUPU
MSDDVTDSYRSSLDDLKMNSKPQISMLTMLAEDHEQFASDIVRVIEEQIKKVQVAGKLPIMYLIDSIIKNLSTTMYPQLFAQCIVQIFCGVFEEVVIASKSYWFFWSFIRKNSVLLFWFFLQCLSEYEISSKGTQST